MSSKALLRSRFIELAFGVAIGVLADMQIPPGAAKTLEPCRDVDAIAMDVFALGPSPRLN